eukprot:TRINITY_DN2148_c0_g1_i5.p1 TRINITY_DN2148_c0_g1~~TRINITY_DN2148_c0_g1_i5.p1  ORF type:complete len:224 (-),score=30.82 TRINITY_DN2148_c0_g1_i5:78-749(-)
MEPYYMEFKFKGNYFQDICKHLNNLTIIGNEEIFGFFFRENIALIWDIETFLFGRAQKKSKKFLLEKTILYQILNNLKFDFNKKNKNGETLLNVEISHGNFEVANLLIDKYNASVNIFNNQEKAPIHIILSFEEEKKQRLFKTTLYKIISKTKCKILRSKGPNQETPLKLLNKNTSPKFKKLCTNQFPKLSNLCIKSFFSSSKRKFSGDLSSSVTKKRKQEKF